jgi:hypothetical protein
MTARQALVSAAVALVIALAILVEWASLPTRLQSAQPKAVAVTANFRPGRGGHAVLADSSGWRAHVHCGKARALCDLLQARPNQVVELQFVRVGMLDDVWLSSAVVDGRELLHLHEVERAFGRSRTIHLAMAAVFLVAAAALGAFSHAGLRSARQKTA